MNELLNELQTTRELYKQIYLRAYSDQKGSDGVSSQHEQEAEDLFQAALEMRILEAADQNTQSNDMRSDRYLYWARVAIFGALGLTAITGIPYVVDQVRY